jgi:hypothetical protein
MHRWRVMRGSANIQRPVEFMFVWLGNSCSAGASGTDDLKDGVMRCLLCDTEMMLMNVVQDDTMPVAGFEHRTFMCSSCHDVERRLVFVGAAEAIPVATTPSIAGEQSDGGPVPLPDATPVTAPISIVHDEPAFVLQDERAVQADPACAVEGEYVIAPQDERTAAVQEQPIVVVQEAPLVAGEHDRAATVQNESSPGMFGRVVARLRGR